MSMWERGRDCMASPARMRPIVGWTTVFFMFNLPPFTVAYFAMSDAAFVSFSLLYLGLISILAMVAGCGSWWQSLRVEEHQEEDANVQDVLDVITNKEQTQ